MPKTTTQTNNNNITFDVKKSTKREFLIALISQFKTKLNSAKNEKFREEYLKSIIPQRDNYRLWSEVPEKKKTNYKGEKIANIQFIVKNDVSKIKFGNHYIVTFNPTYHVKWYLTNVILKNLVKSDLHVGVLHVPAKIIAPVEFAINRLLENIGFNRTKNLLKYYPELLLEMFSKESLDELLFNQNDKTFGLIKGQVSKLITVSENGYEAKHEEGPFKGQIKKFYDPLPVGSARKLTGDSATDEVVLTLKEITLVYDDSKLNKVAKSSEELAAYDETVQKALAKKIQSSLKDAKKVELAKDFDDKFIKLINQYFWLNFSNTFNLDCKTEQKIKRLNYYDKLIDENKLLVDSKTIENAKKARLDKMINESQDVTSPEIVKNNSNKFASAEDHSLLDEVFDDETTNNYTKASVNLNDHTPSEVVVEEVKHKFQFDVDLD